jgi:septal ring factor EnvC (AmiA/AmiB activator)
MLKKNLLLILFIAGITATVSAQPGDKTQLERERQEIQNELKQIQGMYDKVKGQKKQSLGQLNMLKRKIELQERKMASYNREIKMIDDDIYRGNLEIYRLQKQVDTLKSQYARTVVYAYKNRSSYDYVNFIFSASSFNDAVRRIAYLKSYRSYREKLVNTILETQDLIAKRQQQQMGRKQEKNVALQSQVKEKSVLDVQRKEKDAVVSQLKSQEKDLQKELAAKRKRDRDIKNAIDAIVKREIAKAAAAAEEARKREAAEAEARRKEVATTTNPTTTAPKTVAPPKPVEAKKDYLNLNAGDIALNKDFEGNKKRLPWPVDNGIVLIPFGPYTVEGFKDIRDNNPGVTIGTPNAGVPVKAVFDGEVAAVHNYGDGALVVIRHGKYFTSYSNLSGVSVSKGATVSRGQVIGKAGENEDGSGGKVDFILMIENRNVNPQLWLR